MSEFTLLDARIASHQSEYDSAPAQHTIEGNLHRIAVEIEPAQIDVGNDPEDPQLVTKYRCIDIELTGLLTYGRVKSALIRKLYSQDDVEAILLNNEVDELASLQEWRRRVSIVAATICEVETE